MINQLKRHVSWILLAVVVLVPLLAWLASFNWQPIVTTTSVFPLLGVWAWSIMATHYYLGYLELSAPSVFKSSQRYSSISMWLVLLLLLLHPGLLAWQQHQAFGTLPPDSFYGTVASTMAPFIAIGVFAWLLFLAYEGLERLRGNQRVKRLWGWVSLSQILAMILIFIHGLAVGQTVLSGWMVGWWTLLGVLLLPSFWRVIKEDFKTQREATKG